MAIIKSYTDIKQSKKLAEILPIESADMFYRDNGIDVKLMWEHNAQKVTSPCWSLAALLNVLPVSCDDEQHCLALINHNPNDKTEWLCAYEDDKGNLMMECYADNQIDACVAMIEKLHEQNLL